MMKFLLTEEGKKERGEYMQLLFKNICYDNTFTHYKSGIKFD